MQLEKMKTAFFEGFSIDMTLEQALNASHPGPCDADVEALIAHESIRLQLDHISDEALKAELSEFGAWDEDQLSNREENEARIVWIAAGNITEEYPNG